MILSHKNLLSRLTVLLSLDSRSVHTRPLYGTAHLTSSECCSMTSILVTDSFWKRLKEQVDPIVRVVPNSFSVWGVGDGEVN